MNPNHFPYILIITILLTTILTAWVIGHQHRRRQSAYERRYEATQQQLNRSHEQQHQLHLALTAAEQQITHMHELQQQLEHQRTTNTEQQHTLNHLHSELAAAHERIDYLTQREHEYQHLQHNHAQLTQALTDTQIHNEHLHTQIEQERQKHQEKLDLLTEAKETLSLQFQHLANQILEEKSQRFTQQNNDNLNRLLAPLNERMGQFSQLIQTTYEKEAKERLTLENELKRLQTLNTQLHTDAQALTQALTGGQNKTQGNWGEMILESVLENSGLRKGIEYTQQTNAERKDEDGRIRRLQPDVLINLPDGKHIIIDAKVSLTAYLRHTQATDKATAEEALKAHIASIRTHIKSLSLKDYSQLNNINSLDFVFMFIPVEPAYLLALQHDNHLFQECFDKRIMLTGPSTLLATLRTIANIWRNEQQNQNALKIAEEGGKLYDKFVGFISTLESIGKSIDQAQHQYQTAHKQLTEGRGNLITRAQKLHNLGIKATKQIDKNLLEQTHTPPD